MHTLEGTYIHLRPITAADSDALVEAASDGQLWNLTFTVVPSRETVDAYIEDAIRGQRAGTVLPFVIIARESGKIIGSTRFWKIDSRNKKLEIGSTWIAASWQCTSINTEAKFLMLRHAFEVLKCVRVQLTTDILNTRSRAAILRLGAVEEGIIRNERIMPDGRKRTSIRFSIIDEEWARVSRLLQNKLLQRRGA